MLEGLDQINWAELTHAYGSAADVPGLLRELRTVPSRGWEDDVHSAMMSERDHSATIEMELGWVRAAHAAVAAGAKVLERLTAEESADLRVAAAHALACLPELGPSVSKVLLGMRAVEIASPHRAGLLLLLGKLNHQSPDVLEVLHSALQADVLDRVAAAIALARFRPGHYDEAVIEILTPYAEDAGALEEMFQGLPWDFGAEAELSDIFE